MLAELSPALIAEVELATKLLKSKQRICILTGAGISAESGIPTFRDKQTNRSMGKLWRRRFGHARCVHPRSKASMVMVSMASASGR
jgi:hypothetical protein